MGRKGDEPPPLLLTERLLIRPWLRADLDAMAAWPPFTEPLDQVWNWPQQLKQNGSLDLFFGSYASDPSRRTWTILVRGAVAGILQLKQIRQEERDAALGLAFGAPWVGQGFGREALSGFFHIYFGSLAFRLVRLEVAIANRRARKLYETLAMEESRRYWRDAGPEESFRFLEAPSYADVRQYFRWASHGVYQLFAEMELSAERWLAHHPHVQPPAER